MFLVMIFRFSVWLRVMIVEMIVVLLLLWVSLLMKLWLIFSLLVGRCLRYSRLE